jgi:hypothetical protein
MGHTEDKDRRRKFERDKLHRLDEEVRKLKWLISQLVHSFSIVEENPKTEVCGITCQARQVIIPTKDYLDHKLDKSDVGSLRVEDNQARTLYLYNMPTEADKIKVGEGPSDNFELVVSKSSKGEGEVVNVVSNVAERLVATAGKSYHGKASERYDITIEDETRLGSGKTELLMSPAFVDLRATGRVTSEGVGLSSLTFNEKFGSKAENVTLGTSGNVTINADGRTTGDSGKGLTLNARDANYNIEGDINSKVVGDVISTVKGNLSLVINKKLDIMGEISEPILEELKASGCRPTANQNADCFRTWNLTADSSSESICISSAKDSLYSSRGGDVIISADGSCVSKGQTDDHQVILNAPHILNVFGKAIPGSNVDCKNPPERKSVMCWADCPSRKTSEPEPAPEPDWSKPPEWCPPKPKRSRKSRSGSRTTPSKNSLCPLDDEFISWE